MSKQQIVPQWNVDTTSSKTTTQLREVIKATSQDNVQGQGVLAAEALGAGLSVSDDLFAPAIDALGGQYNVKLQNLKISVGLFSGGTASALRTTTPGLKVFLFITGLKMWHIDEDVGAILYQLALSCGVLRSFPVSGYQLQQLSILKSCGSEDTVLMSRVSELIPTKSFMDLLAFVFAGLQNEMVDRITFYGDYLGNWICALLTWLLPNNTFVWKEDHFVFGGGEKLSIYLAESVDESRSWQYFEWKAEKSSFQSPIATSAGNPLGPKFFGSRLRTLSNDYVWMPWSSCRNYIQSSLSDTPPAATIIVGQVAQSLVKLAMFHGYISGSARFSVLGNTRLLDVSSDYFVNHYEYVLAQFGWTEDELTNANSRFRHECELKWTSTIGNKSSIWISFVMSAVYGNLLRPGNRNFEQDVIELGIYVAAEVLSLLTYHPIHDEERAQNSAGQNSMGRICSININFKTYSMRESLLDSVLFLENGMEIENFMSALWKVKLPAASNFRGDELILEGNGVVIVMGLLLNPTMQQCRACALDIFPGMIKKEDHRYNTVRQLNSGGSMKSSSKTLYPFEGGHYLGLDDPFLAGRIYASMEFSTTLKEQEIILRSVIRFGKQSNDHDEYPIYGVELDWLRAAQNLATAKHLGRHDQCNPTTEEKLARNLFDNGSMTGVVWMSAEYDKTVTHTRLEWLRLIYSNAGDNSLRLYQLSIQRDNCAYVIKHDGALIKALTAVPSNCDLVIIT